MADSEGGDRKKYGKGVYGTLNVNCTLVLGQMDVRERVMGGGAEGETKIPPCT